LLQISEEQILTLNLKIYLENNLDSKIYILMPVQQNSVSNTAPRFKNETDRKQCKMSSSKKFLPVKGFAADVYLYGQRM
jgi:hypothetical protein